MSCLTEKKPWTSVSLRNEQGTATVVALIMLVLVTVLGISATNTSTIDIQISGNERVYKESFYLAEGALMEAAQRLNDATDQQLRTLSEIYMNNRDELDESILENPALWDHDGSGGNDYSVASSLDSQNAFFMTVDEGPARGSSLGMEGTNLHQLTVYGASNKGGTIVELMMGFKKRF